MWKELCNSAIVQCTQMWASIERFTVYRTASWVPMVSSLERFTVYRTASWVPVVSSLERFHCIQDSQLGPNGVLYREVPLYTGQPAESQWCPL